MSKVSIQLSLSSNDLSELGKQSAKLASLTRQLNTAIRLVDEISEEINQVKLEI